MSDSIKIRRALLSVYDKTGLVEFATALHEEFAIELISTGGTAKTLKDAGLPVTLVEEVTGFPEMMDGRVKTLHPKIHAGILADRDNPDHMRQLAEQGIAPIDMVVVNLYPFEETIAKPDCTFEEAIEMIDIGGPCLLRAAAKNHRHVVAVSDDERWADILEELRATGGVCSQTSLGLSSDTFGATQSYDGEIWQYLLEQRLEHVQAVVGCAEGEEEEEEDISDSLDDDCQTLYLERTAVPRYGENPHQRAIVCIEDEEITEECAGEFDLTKASQGCGNESELSFNNYADASAALELCAELTRAGGASGGPLWDRFSTGRSVWDRFSTGCSTRNVMPRVSDEQCTRRHLPHIQRPEATYFVTFRLRTGELAPAERDAVLAACTYWHTGKMTLHAACVMPDHVHLLVTPHEIEPNRWVPLGELLHSIKRLSSREINKQRGVQGPLWSDESFDRIMRNKAEFVEKWEYIEANPVTAGIVGHTREYQWFWRSDAGFGEVLMPEGEGRLQTDRLKTGPTVGRRDDRLQTGPTDDDPTDDGPTDDGPTDDGSTAGSQATPCVCFIKHTNACGSAVDGDPVEAYRKAYLGDPNAAMGGILAVNFAVTAEFATAVMETYQRWGKPLREAGAAYAPGAFFIEVWLAPSFDEEAVRIIRGEVEGRPQKAWGKRVRLLDVGDLSVEPDSREMDVKRIAGGVLMQNRDLVGLNEDQWKVVSERQPTDAELDDLRLAWLVCKHTKSNAITVCKDGMLLGNGAGQMSRVMSCRIATWLARENGHAGQLAGAAAASDAFFPFADGPDILADAGVTAIIQPGGSKRDQEVIDAANKRGLAMVVTGTRHFRH